MDKILEEKEIDELLKAMARDDDIPMKKVFVSAAVKGLNEKETVAKHAEYRKKITDIIGEYQDISDNVSGFHSQGGLDRKDIKNPSVYWFGKGLVEELANADLAVFCGDISQTRGCRIEKLICEIYGIPHLVID